LPPHPGSAPRRWRQTGRNGFRRTHFHPLFQRRCIQGSLETVAVTLDRQVSDWRIVAAIVIGCGHPEQLAVSAGLRLYPPSCLELQHAARHRVRLDEGNGIVIIDAQALGQGGQGIAGTDALFVDEGLRRGCQAGDLFRQRRQASSSTMDCTGRSAASGAIGATPAAPKAHRARNNADADMIRCFRDDPTNRALRAPMLSNLSIATIRSVKICRFVVNIGEKLPC
jgi:hypothetical protein